MLALDFHKWDKRKVPIICEMYKDERCPCLQNCVIFSICTRACDPMRDYIATNVSETLSYLREHMGKEYSNRIEDGKSFIGEEIFNGLVGLHYHTVLQDDGIYDEWACIMKRYYYTMRRSHQIAKNHCRMEPQTNISHFFIGM